MTKEQILEVLYEVQTEILVNPGAAQVKVLDLITDIESDTEG